MIYLLIIPIALQATAMFVDEFYFHRKRGLPRWERVGHPIDSFSVLLCYLFLLLTLPTLKNITIYAGLSFISCLLITKDEFVHSERCEPSENWLHALLFVLHPITFFCAGVIWYQDLSVDFLFLQPLVVGGFMLYQIIYWSRYAKSE